MVDVRNEKELKAWLDEQSHQTKIAFANRLAMRVLPFVLDRLSRELESDSTTKIDFSLFCFRGSLISGVASAWPTPEISDELTLAIRANLAIRATLRATRANLATRATLDAIRATLRATLATRANLAIRATLDAIHATIRATIHATRATTLATLENDIEFVESGAGPRTLHQQPLWNKTNIPKVLADSWQSFRDTYSNTEWAFWIEWYQSVLNGKPMDWDLQRQIALIPDEDWEKGAKHIADCIAEIRQSFTDNSAEIVDLIPDQNEHFRLHWSGNDRLQYKTDTDPSDLEAITAYRAELLAPDGPVEILRDHFRQYNNTPQASLFAPLLDRYFEELSRKSDTIRLPILITRGRRLHNASASLSSDEAKKEWPDLEPQITSAIDDLCDLHGFLTMDTSVGNEMLAKAKEYQTPDSSWKTDDDRRLEQFVQTVANQPDLMEPDSADILVELTEPMPTDEHPGRSSYVKQAMILSTVTTLVGGAAWYFIGPVVGMPILSLPGLFAWEAVKKMKHMQRAAEETARAADQTLDNAIQETTEKYAKMASYTEKNNALLRQLADSHKGLKWINQVLNWIEKQPGQGKD